MATISDYLYVQYILKRHNSGSNMWNCRRRAESRVPRSPKRTGFETGFRPTLAEFTNNYSRTKTAKTEADWGVGQVVQWCGQRGILNYRNDSYLNGERAKSTDIGDIGLWWRLWYFHLHVDMATLALELYILDNVRKGKREYVFRTMSYGHRALPKTRLDSVQQWK